MRVRPHALLALAPVLLIPVQAECGAPEAVDAVEARSGRPVEDPTGGALRHFYDALAATERRSGQALTRIIHYGDSHAAADILTASLRQSFRGRFGDGGPGFVYAGKPWHWYSRKGVTNGASSGWSVAGTAQPAPGATYRNGLSGISLTADGTGETVWVSSPGDRFAVVLAKQPGGGAVDVALDGASVARAFSLASRRFEPAFVEAAATGSGPHTIEVRTVAPGPTRVHGFVVERSGAGVVYDALGINGARASLPLAWDWREVDEELAWRSPDLVVVAYGTNEVTDPDFELTHYGGQFRALLSRLASACPDASVLVVSPPDRAVWTGERWRSVRDLPALVAVQRRVALDAGAAFWDQYASMGGEGSVERWATRNPALARADRVHLTSAGYGLVAGMLFDALMDGYRAYVDARRGARRDASLAKPRE